MKRDELAEKYSKRKPTQLDERHGMSNTPIYRLWKGMIRRCHNPNATDFKHYGAKGIFVCDEWRNSFLAFYNHIGDRPSLKHTVDRIDSTKGYEPNNVRWADWSLQQYNKPKKANSACKYKGVTRVKGMNTFQARISHKGKQTYLGSFKTEAEAGKAYHEAAIRLHGVKR